MIDKLSVTNFRSLKKANIDLGKITVLTGANNSGKSSVLYAMLILKNFLQNPNQNIENILIPGDTNLGGIEELKYKGNSAIFGNTISIGIESKSSFISTAQKFEIKECKSTYTLNINQTGNSSELLIKSNSDFSAKDRIVFGMPFTGNVTKKFTLTDNNKTKFGELLWNGLSVLEFIADPKVKAPFSAGSFVNCVNRNIQEIRNIDYVPINRRFSKLYYSLLPLSNIITQDEIASLLASDKELDGRVSKYIEKIVGKFFYSRYVPGINSFQLLLRDKQTNTITDIVNEGLGVNQLVFMLTKLLNNSNLILIDEPEIHLHPSYIDRLVDSFIEIIKNEKKQIVISTHSEHLLSALLTKVSEDLLAPEDIKIHYLTKEGLDTKFELQSVNEKGQVEGGLKSFYESELKNMESFFKIKK